MSGGQVPVWVPLLVAFVGLMGILATQILTGRREERRLAAEAALEEARWRRERDHDAAERHAERKREAYAELISMIENWGWRLYPTARAVIDGERSLTAEDAAEVRELRQLVGSALGAASLYASDEVREALRLAVTSRADVTRALIGGVMPPEELRSRWHDSWQRTRELQRAIRSDLGLDA